jgi:hypothetical protein
MRGMPGRPKLWLALENVHALVCTPTLLTFAIFWTADEIAADVAAEVSARAGDAAAPATEGEVVTDGAVLLTGAGTA